METLSFNFIPSPSTQFESYDYPGMYALKFDGIPPNTSDDKPPAQRVMILLTDGVQNPPPQHQGNHAVLIGGSKSELISGSKSEISPDSQNRLGLRVYKFTENTQNPHIVFSRGMQPLDGSQVPEFPDNFIDKSFPVRFHSHNIEMFRKVLDTFPSQQIAEGLSAWTWELESQAPSTSSGETKKWVKPGANITDQIDTIAKTAGLNPKQIQTGLDLLGELISEALDTQASQSGSSMFIVLPYIERQDI